MTKLDYYLDEYVFKKTKEYIKQNMKSGDYLTRYNCRRLFMIGYNKASRIIKTLSNDNIISDTGICPVVI